MAHCILFSFQSFFVDHREILVTLFVGAIGGLIAQLITPGRGFGMITTLAIGLLGGWLGGMLFKHYLDFSGNAVVDAIIRSVAGSLILCIIINLIFGSKNNKERDHADWEA